MFPQAHAITEIEYFTLFTKSEGTMWKQQTKYSSST